MFPTRAGISLNCGTDLWCLPSRIQNINYTNYSKANCEPPLERKRCDNWFYYASAQRNVAGKKTEVTWTIIKSTVKLHDRKKSTKMFNVHQTQSLHLPVAKSTAWNRWWVHAYVAKQKFSNRQSCLHRRIGAQSTLGGQRHFCPKICVWKINEMYLLENVTKFPKFTWYLPENAQILHDLPENFFSRNFVGGHVPLLPPPSPRLLRLCTLFVDVPQM